MRALRSAGLVLLFTALATALLQPAEAKKKGDKHLEKQQHKVEMAQSARTSIVAAITAASDKVPGTIVEARLDRKRDRTVWRIEVVTAEGELRRVYVDTASGALIDEQEIGTGRSGPRRGPSGSGQTTEAGPGGPKNRPPAGRAD